MYTVTATVMFVLCMHVNTPSLHQILYLRLSLGLTRVKVQHHMISVMVHSLRIILYSKRIQRHCKLFFITMNLLLSTLCHPLVGSKSLVCHIWHCVPCTHSVPSMYACLTQ